MSSGDGYEGEDLRKTFPSRQYTYILSRKRQDDLHRRSLVMAIVLMNP
jgi:hypothetical protein